MTTNEAANELVQRVCEELNLDVRTVRTITVGVRSIEVCHFETNEDGSKFIRDGGKAAIATRVLPFQYLEPVF